MSKPFGTLSSLTSIVVSSISPYKQTIKLSDVFLLKARHQIENFANYHCGIASIITIKEQKLPLLLLSSVNSSAEKLIQTWSLLSQCSMAPFTNREKISRVLGCFRMEKVTNQIPTQFNENFEGWKVMFSGDLHNKTLAQRHQLMRKVRILPCMSMRSFSRIWVSDVLIEYQIALTYEKNTFPGWQNSLSFPIFSPIFQYFFSVIIFLTKNFIKFSK